MATTPNDFAYFNQAEPLAVLAPKAGLDTGDFAYFNQGEPLDALVATAAATTEPARRRLLTGAGV